MFLLFSLLTSFSFAQAIDPGIWQAKSNFQVAGIDFPESKSEECVPIDEAKDLKTSLTRELTKNGCTATKWDVKGKKIDIELSCNKSGLDAKGKLTGSVTAKSYDLSGTAQGTYHSIQTSAHIQLSGKWLKACEKYAKDVSNTKKQSKLVK
jgi:hypothetical protein